MNAKELIRDTERLLLTQQHCTLEQATAPQLHNALSTAAMEALTPLWMRSQRKREGKRQAYYLSAEYLMGRMVYNNLYCLGLLADAQKLLAEKGVDLTMLEDIEDDAFGNGYHHRARILFFVFYELRELVLVVGDLRNQN